MATTIENAWTTVTSKKGYVPPHLRNKEAAEVKALSLDNDDDFPTLGGISTPKKMTSNPFELNLTKDFPSLGGGLGSYLKASFTQKVKDLIEAEQQDEVARAASEEKKRELEGYVSLSLKFTPERYLEWNEKMSSSVRSEKDIQDLSLFVNSYVTPTTYPTPIFQNNTDSYSIYNDDFSELDADDFEEMNIDHIFHH